MDKSEHSCLVEDRLISLYEEILAGLTFERYEVHREEIDALFSQLQQRESRTNDQGKLREIKMLHDQIVSMIQSEKDNLEGEILSYRSKKNVSSHYGKVSVYEPMDAFFIDFKK